MRGCNNQPTGYVSVKDEADIFRILGAEYKTPEERSM
jgi:DNA polymerase/3'-5' exonuclease PolX